MLYFCPFYGNADSLLFVFKYANSQTVRPSTNDHLVFIIKVLLVQFMHFAGVLLYFCEFSAQIHKFESGENSGTGSIM